MLNPYKMKDNPYTKILARGLIFPLISFITIDKLTTDNTRISLK